MQAYIYKYKGDERGVEVKGRGEISILTGIVIDVYESNGDIIRPNGHCSRFSDGSRLGS